MKYTLFTSLRSPFARRIRLLLKEMKSEGLLDYNETFVDVFNPTLDFFEANPLGRVPALKLENGRVLVESSLIVEYLKSKYPGYSRFAVSSGYFETELVLSGYAIGIMDLTVQYFIESLKPKMSQDHSLFEEIERNIIRTLSKVEMYKDSTDSFTQNKNGVCDFDLICALSYMKFRMGTKILTLFPKTAGWLEKKENQDFYLESVPKN